MFEPRSQMPEAGDPWADAVVMGPDAIGMGLTHPASAETATAGHGLDRIANARMPYQEKVIRESRPDMERAILGVDGNAAYALLGADLQGGESEFEIVDLQQGELFHEAAKRAALVAFDRLKARLNLSALTYDWGPGVQE